MVKLSVVYITTATVEEARTLAKAIIEAKLGACVNYWQNLASVYQWEGVLCEEQEVVMVVKTTRAQVERLKTFVETRHSYTLPCIIELDVLSANPTYARWVDDELKRH